MKSRIDLITILTDNVEKMKSFYQDVLGFSIKNDSGSYVEFDSPGVRFAICERSLMRDATGNPSFGEERRGQTFELAFPLDMPEQVDEAFAKIVAQGAVPVKEPEMMPWGQRTAFFADPDGNVHELFANLPQS